MSLLPSSSMVTLDPTFDQWTFLGSSVYRESLSQRREAGGPGRVWTLNPFGLLPQRKLLEQRLRGMAPLLHLS